MEYISKIRLKNNQNDYDTYYPVTKTSALIMDDGVKNIAKNAAPFIANEGYDFNINELNVNKANYKYVSLWSGNAEGHLDTSGYPTNNTIYSIDNKYNFSHFNIFAIKITSSNSAVMGYVYCDKRSVPNSNSTLLMGATPDMLSVNAPNKTIINSVQLNLINDNSFMIYHVGTCLLEESIPNNGLIYSYGNLNEIYGVC